MKKYNICKLINKYSCKWIYVLSIIAGMMIFAPLLNNEIVKKILENIDNQENLLNYIILLVVFMAINVVIENICYIWSYRLNNKLLINLEKDFSEMNKNMKPLDITSNDTANEKNIIESNSESILLIPKLFCKTVFLILSILPIINALYRYQLLYILLILFIPTIFNIILRKVKIESDDENYRLDIHQRKKFYYFEQMLFKRYATERIAFSRSDNIICNYLDNFDEVTKSRSKINIKYEKYSFVFGLISTVFCVLVCWPLIYLQYLHLGLDVSDLIYLIGISQICNTNFLDISDHIRDLSILKRRIKVLNTNYNILSEKKQNNDHKCNVKINDKNIIRFIDVSFSYGDKQIFSKLNLDIDFNNNYSIIGVNGVGKTTLVLLILRFINPDSGKITFNDIDISEIDIYEYYKIFGVCFQNKTILLDSIKNNLLLYDDNLFQKYKYLLSKTDNFEYIDIELTKEFAEDGIELSEGQKQVLNVVRALSKNAKFYIFDEPLSNLDIYFKKEISKSIMGKKHFILITHNLNLALKTEKIIFLEGRNVNVYDNKTIFDNQEFVNLFNTFNNVKNN